MSFMPFCDRGIAAAVQVPSTALIKRGSGGGFSGLIRLPTDPIGIFTLTLTHLVIGSAIQVEAAGNGAVFAFLTADSANEAITLSAYAAGSPLNDLRIKVRKGSAAPYYQPYETLTTAVVGSQSIYVSQIPD